jgi:hypothetical protein
MRSRRDGTGVVFDIYEGSYERFIEIFIHLKESDSRIDFIAEKCYELPDLIDEGGSGGQGDWRTDGYGGGGYEKKSYGQHGKN